MNEFLGVERTITLHSPLLWGIAAFILVVSFWLARRRPAYGLGLVIAATPLYQVRGTVGVPTTLLELILGAVLLGTLTRWREYPLRRTGYEPWLIVWVGGALLATLTGPDLREGFGLWRAFFFEPALLLLALVTVFRRERPEPILAGALGAVGIIAAWTATLLLSGDVSYDGRLLGPYQSPNFMAMALVPLLLLIAFWPGRQWCWVRLPVGLIGLGMLLATQSRGGYLALCAGVALVIAYQARRIRQAILIPAALLLAAAIGIGALLFHRPQPIIPIRRVLWEQSADIIRHNPVFGVHPGQFQPSLAAKFADDHFYTLYFVPFAPNPHDLWLVTWVEWGLLTVIGLLGLVVRFVRRTLRIDPPWALLAGAMMTAILVHGIVDTTVLKNDLAVLFVVVLALPAVASRSKA